MVQIQTLMETTTRGILQIPLIRSIVKSAEACCLENLQTAPWSITKSRVSRN